MVYINYKCTLISKMLTMKRPLLEKAQIVDEVFETDVRVEERDATWASEMGEKKVPWRAEEMKAVNKFVGDLFRSLQKANQVPGKIPRSCSCELERETAVEQTTPSVCKRHRRAFLQINLHRKTNIGPVMVSIKNQRERETVFANLPRQ